MHVLLHRGGDDLRRGQPDALVHDLESGVAGAHGNLFGAVGMPVQAGLADEELQPAPQLPPGFNDPVPDAGELSATSMHRSAGHPGRRPVFTEGVPQDPGPLPRGHPDTGTGQRRGHQVRVGLGRVPQIPQGLVHGTRVAAGPPGVEIDTGGGLHRRVDGLDRRAQVS